MGTKRSILTDEKGLPLSVVLSGANTHDIKLLEETLDNIIVSRPAVSEEHPQNLCLDAGYTGSIQSVEVRQYAAHIRPRGEERKEIKRNPDFKARRWVVEVTHSFFNRFRKLENVPIGEVRVWARKFFGWQGRNAQESWRISSVADAVQPENFPSRRVLPPIGTASYLFALKRKLKTISL